MRYGRCGPHRSPRPNGAATGRTRNQARSGQRVPPARQIGRPAPPNIRFQSLQYQRAAYARCIPRFAEIEPEVPQAATRNAAAAAGTPPTPCLSTRERGCACATGGNAAPRRAFEHSPSGTRRRGALRSCVEERTNNKCPARHCETGGLSGQRSAPSIFPSPQARHSRKRQKKKEKNNLISRFGPDRYCLVPEKRQITLFGPGDNHAVVWTLIAMQQETFSYEKKKMNQEEEKRSRRRGEKVGRMTRENCTCTHVKEVQGRHAVGVITKRNLVVKTSPQKQPK